MNKKKGIIILLVILLVGIIGIAVFMTFNKEEKETTTLTEKNEVENSTNIVEGTEEDTELTGEELDNEEIDEEEKLTLETSAQDTMEGYISLSKYEASNLGAMPYILVELELLTDEELYTLLETTDVTSKEYIETSVKYEDFKNAILKYISEEYFNKYFVLYKNIDGYVGIQNTAAGLGATEVESAELIEVKNDSYIFKIIFKDVEVYEHYIDGDTYIKENDWLFYDEVTFKYENNKFVISEFSDYTPYIEGVYGHEASDIGYEFFIDGEVEYFSNTILEKGTYKAIDKDVFEITFTEKITYEDDTENKYIDENGYEIIPTKEVVTEIDRVEKVTIVDDGKLMVEGEIDGNSFKGEIIKLEIEN